jgi:hypothetical protein
MVQLVRQNAMTPPMPRQKINAPARHDPANERVRGRPERCFDRVLRHVGEPFHVIKAAAADDSNGGFAHESAIETKALRQWKAKCRNLVSKQAVPGSSLARKAGAILIPSTFVNPSAAEEWSGLGSRDIGGGRRPSEWATNEPISDYFSKPTTL